MFKDNGENKEEDIKQNACQSYEESQQNPFFCLVGAVYRFFIKPAVVKSVYLYGVDDADNAKRQAAKEGDQNGFHQPCFRHWLLDGRSRGCFINNVIQLGNILCRFPFFVSYCPYQRMRSNVFCRQLLKSERTFFFIII